MAVEHFTINHFPPELIEKFCPDFEPRTISSLRLVSQRFHSVFSADRYYRSYLLYPIEYYLSDLKSESTAHGVKEVLDNLKSRKEGVWRNYICLQKAHLDNWRKGRTDNVDRVELPYSALKIDKIEETIDESNERWLLISFFVGDIFVLINFTNSKPQVLIEDLRHERCRIFLLPGLVVVEYYNQHELSVYKITKENSKHALTYQYKLNDVKLGYRYPYSTTLERSFFLSGKRKMETTIDNFLVIYYHTTMTLEVWDLKLGKICKTINLCDFDFTRDFLQTNGQTDVHLKVSPGTFPNVIVLLEYSNHSSDMKQITIIDVEENILHLVDEFEYQYPHEIDWCLGMTCDKVYMFTDTQLFRIYRLLPLNSRAELIFTIKPLGSNPLVYENGKTALWINNVTDKYHIVNIGADVIGEKVVQNRNRILQKLNKHEYLSNVYSFLVPGIILCKRYPAEEDIMVAFDTLAEKDLFHLRNSLYSYSHTNYLSRLEYPSKVVVFGEDKELKIYNF